MRRNTGLAGTFGLLAVVALFAGSRVTPALRTASTSKPHPQATAKPTRFKLGADTTGTADSAATASAISVAPARANAKAKMAPKSVAAATKNSRTTRSARRRRVGPTPVFAYAEGLILALPYPKSKVTAIAYHQVYAPGSLRLVPAPQMTHLRMPNDGPIALEQARESKSVTKKLRQRRMFRSDRSGPADRAVDVGAKRNTVARAPVSGKVIQVRPYMLYGRYGDVEVDILPDAKPSVRVIIFHVCRVAVRKGQRVVSGVTPVGRVRDLASCFEPQLAEFTHERGNHVHIQIKPLDVE